jgi:hypothetical protein
MEGKPLKRELTPATAIRETLETPATVSRGNLQPPSPALPVWNKQACETHEILQGTLARDAEGTAVDSEAGHIRYLQGTSIAHL